MVLNMNPKISVIIPCWGVEKYLDRCLESVVNQTLKELEIILVDDESPDKVPEMCDAWAQKDSRIKVIHKKNEGLGFARNSGLEIATGEYVAFLDSDDFLDHEAYATVYNIAINNQLDVCYYQRRRVDQNDKKIEVSSQKTIDTYYGRKEVDTYMLNLIGHKPSDKIQRTESFSVCMGIMRRSIIERYNCRFPSEKIVASEDLLFQLDFLPHVERVTILPNVYYNYFINTASITQNYNEAKRDRMKRLLNEIKNKFVNTNLKDIYIPHFNTQILRIYRTILKFESRSKLSLSQKMRRIKEECSSEQMQSIYSDYISSYPLNIRLYLYAMKYNIVIFFIIYYALKKKY